MKNIRFMSFIILTGLLIGGLKDNTVQVLAAEKGTVTVEKPLAVEIIRSDGVCLSPQENEVICTNTALTFSFNGALIPEVFDYKIKTDGNNALVDELLEYRTACQYCISSDGGDSYSEWTDLGGSIFTLIPGSVADGRYNLKFRKLEKYSVKSQEEVLGNISDNKVYKKKVKEFDKIKKKADAIVDSEPVHVLESRNYSIIVDTGAPTVDFVSDRDMEAWTGGDIRCLIRVNDTLSRPAWLRATIEGNRIVDENYDKNASMSGNDKEIVITAESIGDDGGELTVEVSDNAGNINVIKKPVRIDKTPPVIDIEGADNRGIYREPVSIFVKGEDAHPETVMVEYTLKKLYEGNEEVLESMAKSLSEVREGPLFTTVGDGDYMVECRARDRAGNESQSVKRSFRIDTIPPGVNFTGINDGSVINREGELKINAFDNYQNDYTVTLTGSLIKGNGTKDLRLADYKTDGKYSVNTYYFNEDGEYRITARVEDAAGNSFEDTTSFTIDTIAPTVEIISGINIKEDMVTNVPPEISFRIKEDNYATAGVVCDLYRIGDDGKRELVQSPEWILDEAASDFSITIDEEGAYELNVTAADRAGNTAGKSIKFTLDTTKPDIEYVENLDKKYIRSFKLPDNFSEYIKDKSSVDYKTYINSMNYDEGREINEDGKYVLKVSAVDDAGNQAEKTVEFIVDSTQPQVIIDGMADDGSVNKDDIIVLSLYDRDDYFKSVKLNGREYVTQDKQQTVELTIPEYGDYKIDIEASDLAENVLTQSIEAKCANSSPVSKGTSTVRTLKQNEKSGSNKGLRIFLIVLTVLILGGSIAVYCLYSIKQDRMYQ